MDQLSLAITPEPGIGHNNPPEPIDPVAALKDRLAVDHADLVTGFHNFELACARVPDPINSEEEAGLATDFIAQCQLQIKTADAAHKREKELFLTSGRVVDAFFKRRCEELTLALAPPIARLKAYRDRVAAAARRRHHEAQQRAEAEAHCAAELRAEAKRLAHEAKSEEDRARAAEQLRLAEDAALRAAIAEQQVAEALEPTRIRGDYGATAYVRRSWTFEVVDLDQVPREYMSLDTEVVREAINKDKVREIPGLRIFETEALRVRGVA
jgi:hypothetical protein